MYYMEKVELDIISNGMDGEGIAKKDGKVFFVQNAVEGDKVICEVVKQNKNYNTAIVDTYIEKSKLRQLPKCKYYGVCGGCSLQHINYEKGIEIKTNNIKSLFKKLNVEADILECKPSLNNYKYRNKLSLYLTKENILGFNKKHSNQLIPIEKCELVNEKFNYLIKLLNNFLKINKEFNSFVLKGITIRQIDEIFIISFVLKKKINLEKLQKYLKLNKINFSLYYCINTSSNISTYPMNFVGGEDMVQIEEFGIKYKILPMSFLQVNNEVKTKIYNKIISLINDDEIVLDAYSGAGLLSGIISKRAKKVYSIEIDKSAHEACKDLIKQNKLKNVTPILGDCMVEVPKLLLTTQVDAVILDPARRGADGQTLQAIICAKPKRIIYLSCNPATLARDLKIILDSCCYKISLVQPYDMFPQTSEVETLVVLDRENLTKKYYH